MTDGRSRSAAEDRLRRAIHKTIQRVTDDIEAFKFNTAVAALMEFANVLSTHLEHCSTSTRQETTGVLIRLLAPFAPHIAEELWARQGGEFSVHQQAWPEHDPDLAADRTITLVIQVNGKVRDRISVPSNISDGGARRRALESDQVQRHLDGQPPKRVVVVPGRLVNIVV